MNKLTYKQWEETYHPVKDANGRVIKITDFLSCEVAKEMFGNENIWTTLKGFTIKSGIHHTPMVHSWCVTSKPVAFGDEFLVSHENITTQMLDYFVDLDDDISEHEILDRVISKHTYAVATGRDEDGATYIFQTDSLSIAVDTMNKEMNITSSEVSAFHVLQEAVKQAKESGSEYIYLR